MDSYLAVIDIGKTNKKVLIFDQALQVVDTSFKKFEEYLEAGIIYEDLENMTDWIIQQIREFAEKYAIKALSVTTHGAMAVAIDQEGKPAIPPVAYTTDAGETFRGRFFQTFGSPQALKMETGTTEIGSLVNIGKMIFFMQETWPVAWSNVWKILNFPQYFGYLFTGQTGAEPTYVGCHTYLYNPSTQLYSSVAKKLGIVDLLPKKVNQSWDVLGTVSPDMQAKTGLPEDCIVTMGIHDSNASLLPYLVKGFENFILNSTGTWCVAMHPTSSIDFKESELEAFVFYNLNVFHEPVKTAIFKGGTEFETYHKILTDLNGDKELPCFKPGLFSEILKNRNQFILPAVDPGLGIYPFANARVMEEDNVHHLEEISNGTNIPGFFKDFETAMAVLNISLAIQSYHALTMTGFDGTGTIFIEGGFRKNEAYINILGSLFPQAQIALTKLDEATAFGAAILAKAALEGVFPQEINHLFDLDIKKIDTPKMDLVHDYRKEFERLVYLHP